MKKKSSNKVIFFDSEIILRLENADEIKVEFIKENSIFKSGARFKKVKFWENDEDENDGRANITCEIVNNCRKKAKFVIYFDEIKRIYDSKDVLIWENPNL